MPVRYRPRRPNLPHAAAGGGLIALALLGAAGCDIEKPALPTFTTQVVVPLGQERLDIADVIDDEAYLTELGDAVLGFVVDGDADTVALDFDLAADIPEQTIDTSLGAFTLDLAAPVDFDFTLADLYPVAAGLDGQTLPVPPFPIAQSSDPHDLADVDSAHLASGSLTVTVHNGLPVPVSADAGADHLMLALVDPATGSAFVTIDFDAIAPGADAVQTADLTGAWLPGEVSVQLTGGSPGSEGAFVVVDAAANISVHADFADLTVDEASAVIDAQELHTTFTTDLPADYGVLQAVIADGAATLDVTNAMPIPCHAVVTWPSIVDLDEQPLQQVYDLAPGATIAAAVDFGGRIVRAADSVPLNAIVAEVDVTSPGSAGGSVHLTSTDGLRAQLGAGRITFASVTGSVPATEYTVDAIDADIDLPEELSGLQLTRATLTLALANTAGIEADADLALSGTSASGDVRELAITQRIAAGEVDRAEVTTIVLDEANSTIVDFLNNLPTHITLTGGVHVGGDGTIGTVHAGDHAVVDWHIEAPVEFVVDDSRIYGDPNALGLDTDTRNLLRDHAGDALADLEVLNHLPVGVELRVLFATDTTSIRTDPLLAIGPLSIAAAEVDPQGHTVTEPVTSHPLVALTADDTQVLATEGLYSVLEVHLPSTDGEPVRVLTTDYLEVHGVIRLDVRVSDD